MPLTAVHVQFRMTGARSLVIQARARISRQAYAGSSQAKLAEITPSAHSQQAQQQQQQQQAAASSRQPARGRHTQRCAFRHRTAPTSCIVW
jgi:protein subunit release factor B